MLDPDIAPVFPIRRRVRRRGRLRGDLHGIAQPLENITILVLSSGRASGAGVDAFRLCRAAARPLRAEYQLRAVVCRRHCRAETPARWDALRATPIHPGEEVFDLRSEGHRGVDVGGLSRYQPAANDEGTEEQTRFREHRRLRNLIERRPAHAGRKALYRSPSMQAVRWVTNCLRRMEAAPPLS